MYNVILQQSQLDSINKKNKNDDRLFHLFTHYLFSFIPSFFFFFLKMWNGRVMNEPTTKRFISHLLFETGKIFSTSKN